ncbi:hypothetical protein SA58113_0884 [Staphylococcus argenteus]|nr:hypothetical protein SA58113_0884 [Staphylococcus argenteus]
MKFVGMSKKKQKHQIKICWYEYAESQLAIRSSMK